MEAIKDPRFEDFEIQYHSRVSWFVCFEFPEIYQKSQAYRRVSQKNKYAYLGLGFVPADVDASPLADRSPHLSKEFLDQRYYDSFQA